MGIPRLRAPRLRAPWKVEAPFEDLSGGHYTMEGFTQRMTVRSWKRLLLDERDKIMFEGRCRRLVAKRMGFGVVEVSKAPLTERT